MADNIRIGKVLKEYNIGLGTLVDFLSKKGYTVEANPNAKISAEEFALVEKEFAKEQRAKEESKMVAKSVKEIMNHEKAEDQKKREEREALLEAQRAKEMELKKEQERKEAEERARAEELKAQELLREMEAAMKREAEEAAKKAAEAASAQKRGPVVVGKIDLSKPAPKTPDTKEEQRPAGEACN